MITLNTLGDYLVVFLISGLAGLFGGLAAELLLNRNGETGAFELPARKGGLFDLGGFASLLVGAVVGIAILVVFPPETTVTNSTGGATQVARAYDAVRLVATSLVAGSAGGSVLTALQARVTAAVNESRVQWAVEANDQQVTQLAAAAKDAAAKALKAAGAGGGGTPGGALGDMSRPGGEVAAPGPSADQILADISADIDRHAEQARAAVKTAARV
jgi:hypothetical protein